MSPFVILEKRIPASIAEADALCLQLRSLMAKGGSLWARERFAVELLAREALTNAVRHGCHHDESLRVSFRCRLGRQRIILIVADAGDGFDWRALLIRPKDEDSCHGRGLTIYQLNATHFYFNPCGNRILLIRSITGSTMPERDTTTNGTQAIFHPGDLTAATVDQARNQLKALLQGEAREVVIDLTGVQMVDSMGIGLMIQVHNSLSKNGGVLIVKNASTDLRDLFRSMRLDKRFSIQD